MIILYLITVLISYVLLREGVKKIDNADGSLEFQELVILIVMLLVPVLNLVASLGVFLDFSKNKSDSLSLIERFFLLKK